MKEWPQATEQRSFDTDIEKIKLVCFLYFQFINRLSGLHDAFLALLAALVSRTL